MLQREVVKPLVAGALQAARGPGPRVASDSLAQVLTLLLPSASLLPSPDDLRSVLDVRAGVAQRTTLEGDSRIRWRHRVHTLSHVRAA